MSVLLYEILTEGEGMWEVGRGRLLLTNLRFHFTAGLLKNSVFSKNDDNDTDECEVSFT